MKPRNKSTILFKLDCRVLNYYNLLSYYVTERWILTTTVEQWRWSFVISSKTWHIQQKHYEARSNRINPTFRPTILEYIYRILWERIFKKHCGCGIERRCSRCYITESVLTKKDIWTFTENDLLTTWSYIFLDQFHGFNFPDQQT